MLTMTQPTLNDAALTPDAMWQAVLADDATLDGVFVIAVRTTGIYCRPSCTARLPKRENIEFFPTNDDARAAGYRACKRCHPDDLQDAHAQLIAQVCRFIDAHSLDERITLERLSEEFHISPFHLHRTFKRVMGITPAAYVDTVRMTMFKQELKADSPVLDAVYAAGFSSNSLVYARTDEQLGMTPTVYREGAPVAIGYAVTPSALGWLLVAATERGICAVKLGDDAESLVAELRGEFSAARITVDDHGLHTALEVITCYLTGETPHLDLPLDLRATAFQRQVWEALCHIPYGETRTYAQVAAAIDQPNAARAVGSACGSNQTALIIPCHRVVRNDGAEGGYRWGVARKFQLLAMERERRTGD